MVYAEWFLFCQPQLPLVYLVDIFTVNNLHCRNSFIAKRAMNVGPYLRVVINEYSGIVFCYTVTMNLQ